MAGDFFKDAVILSWENFGFNFDTNDEVRSYDLLVSSLSISGEGSIVTSLGATVDRTVTITNGGLGQLDDFTFYIIDGFETMTTQLETPNGIILTQSAMSGDTIFYIVSSIEIAEFGNNDVHFDNGEQVMLKRTYIVTECDNESSYQAAWGCGADICQATSILNQPTVIENVIPNLMVTMPNPDPNYCFDGSNDIVGGAPVIQTFEVKNIGNGPATNFNFTLRSFQSGSNTGWNYYSATAPWTIIEADGNMIPMINIEVINTKSIENSDCGFSTHPSVLKQEAPSSVIIPPGESIFIEVPTYVPNLECDNLCEQFNMSWYSYSNGSVPNTPTAHN